MNTGANVLQSDDGNGDANGGAGVCSTVAANLDARRNVFGSGKDCATTPAVLTKTSPCGHSDVGVSNGATIDTTSAPTDDTAVEPAHGLERLGLMTRPEKAG